MASIAFELPSNVIYVAGHVNGVETVFQQDRLNTERWRAEVDAAENNLYHIVLEMYDEAGNVGYYDKIMEYILPVFIYDRVQADVDYVRKLQNIGWQNMTQKQKEEWLDGLKGCLNSSDLKRIENDIYVIAQLLRVDLQTNKDNLPEIPDGLYFQQMINNVEKLRQLKYLHSDTPETPSQPLNTYQKINDIERILHDIYEVYNMNNSRFCYCGMEVYTGEETGLL